MITHCFLYRRIHVHCSSLLYSSLRLFNHLSLLLLKDLHPLTRSLQAFALLFRLDAASKRIFASIGIIIRNRCTFLGKLFLPKIRLTGCLERWMPIVACHQVFGAIHLFLEHLFNLVELLRVDVQRFLLALEEVFFVLTALIKDTVFVYLWGSEFVEEGGSIWGVYHLWVVFFLEDFSGFWKFVLAFDGMTAFEAWTGVGYRYLLCLFALIGPRSFLV